MRQEKWNEYLQRSKTWSIRMGYDLLHSKAYRDLKYGPAIKCLNWFYEKVKVKVDKHKRGKKRYQVIDGGQMYFTYEEARLRGLSQNQFSRALKELYKLGFIDVEHFGSGLHGDPSVFIWSKRWRDYGTPQFTNQEFPNSVAYGYRGKQKKLPKSILRRKMKRDLLKRIEESYLTKDLDY